METEFVYEFVRELCCPYPWLMLVLGTAILLARRNREISGIRWWSMFLAWAAILVLSIPLVTFALMGTLEWRYLPSSVLPKDIDAIVILGGGVMPPTEIRPTPEPSGSSLTRCLYAYDLYRYCGSCPILVCGGATEYGQEGVTEADVMRRKLIQLGVSSEDVLVETHSTTTHENAAKAASRIREHEWRKVLLVTHARHLFRSELCFLKQGIAVYPAPCSFKSDELTGAPYEWFIPSPGALGTSHDCFHEWVGMVWYWWHDRI